MDVVEARQKLAGFHGTLNSLVEAAIVGPGSKESMREKIADGMLVLQEVSEASDRALTLARNNARTFNRKIEALQKRLRKLEPSPARKTCADGLG